MPIPKELKKLEQIIRIETKSRDNTYFTGCSQHDIDKGNAYFYINLSIENDSIVEKGFELYVNSVNKRINDKLTNKKSIDSLIIEVSCFFKKEKIDSLKFKHYRYSFPVK